MSHWALLYQSVCRCLYPPAAVLAPAWLCAHKDCRSGMGQLKPARVPMMALTRFSGNEKQAAHAGSQKPSGPPTCIAACCQDSSLHMQVEMRRLSCARPYENEYVVSLRQSAWGSQIETNRLGHCHGHIILFILLFCRYLEICFV